MVQIGNTDLILQENQKTVKSNSNRNSNATVNGAAIAAAETASAARMPVKKLCAILAVFSFVLYANTLMNGYAFDDYVMVVKNSLVNSGFSGIPKLLTTSRMAGAGTSTVDNYRPLSLIMFAAEHQIFGDSPKVGHFFNILFYAGCVVLLFLFLDRLFEGRKTAVAFVAALLFLVHPIHTEVVANIKSRDEILCFFFGFLSLLLFLSYMERGKWRDLALAGLSLFLSYLSKETTITFLLVIPLVFFLYRRDNRTRAAVIAVVTVVVSLLFLLIRSRILAGQGMGAGVVGFMDNALATAAPATRLATAILVLGMYLRLLFIPYPLSCDYCFNSIPLSGFGDVGVWLALAVYAVLAALAVRLLLKNSKSPWAFGILFFLVTLSLFSNIPILIGSEMGERFLFFASVGFCLVVALSVEKWLFTPGQSSPAVLRSGKVLALLVPVCLLYSGLTIARNGDWKDNFTLFKADVEKLPMNAKLNYFAGYELIANQFPNTQDKSEQKQLFLDGLKYLRNALSIYPEYADGESALGSAFFSVNAMDSAEAHFSKALALNSRQYAASNNLAIIYMHKSNYTKAVEAYRKSLVVLPDNAQGWYDMGGCYIQMKQYDSAIAALRQAVRFDPQLTDGYMQLGLACFLVKNYAEAEKCITKALELQPGDVPALGNLATVYLSEGKNEQALDLFKKVLAADPNAANAYSNIGHCYFKMRQFAEAVAALEKAVSLHSGNDKDIPCLALSYKALGDKTHAMQYEAMAKKIHPDFSLQSDIADY